MVAKKMKMLSSTLMIGLILAVSQNASQTHAQTVENLPEPIVKLKEEINRLQQDKEKYSKEFRRAKSVQDREEERILALPGVVSIGIGHDQGQPIFIVGVESEAHKPSIPSEIEGVRVRVDIGGPVQLLDDALSGCDDGSNACHTDATNLPMEMGNSARWFQANGGCTAGFRACDPVTGKIVFVTNSHCAQFNVGCQLAPIGDAVWHPAVGDDGPGVERTIVGRISGHAAPICGSNSNFVDATKIETDTALTSIAHRDFGTPSGSATDLQAPDIIAYSGRSSGASFGTLVAVNVTINVPPPSQGGFCCGSLTMRNQMTFDPIDSVRGGDSGSGVLAVVGPSASEIEYKVAGLLWGNDGNLGVFTPLDIVLDELSLTMDFSQCASSLSFPKTGGDDYSR